MKNIIRTVLVSISCLIGISVGAQDAIFKNDVEQFIELSNQSKWNQVIEMMHPKMFSSFTKEQMIQLMNQMNAMGLKTKTTLKKIKKVHPAIGHENVDYQKIDYDVSIVVTLTEQMWAQKDFILQGVKNNFGGGDLKIDESTKTLSMDGAQSMIAIKSSSESSWKYMTYQGPEDVLVKSALPNDVFNQIVK